MYCKFTDQNLQTHNGFQWKIGEWKETSGEGALCTNGWLHCYTHPLLAVFLNPVHAQIRNPRLFEIEVAGKIQEDYGLKVGFTKMRLTKEIPLPQITDKQRIAFGILSAKKVETNKIWQEWAEFWFNNKSDMFMFVASDTDAGYHAHLAAVNKNNLERSVAAAVCQTFNPLDILDLDSGKWIERQGFATFSTPITLIEIAEKALLYK